MNAEKIKDEEMQKTAQEDGAKGADSEFTEAVKSGFMAPIWSVVSFENCVARGLIYEDALAKMLELSAEQVSGLCIVTDDAASRMYK